MSLRVITSYKLAGTRSFRLSATKLFGRWGMNLQNPDKHTSDICVAPPGHVIVQADQSGAEALIVAELARAGRYRDLFDHGIKPHTFLAAILFHDKFGLDPVRYIDNPVEVWSKFPEWPDLHRKIKNSGKPYDIGKRTAHGSSYRMGPITFRNANIKQSQGSLILSVPECKVFLGMFRELFPEIVEWQEDIEMQIIGKRELTNLFGFVRHFYRPITDSYIREAISWIPQSTVGCITHQGIRKARAADLSVCSNKHDSYAVICREDEALDVARFMQRSMAVTLRGRDRDFTMKSEVQVGRNWRAFHETKNPNGMKEVKL